MQSDRYEKRHKNLAAHVSPAFRAELGDVVTVGMCVRRCGARWLC
jgi:small subunit ribosomal protein S11e